MHYRLAASPNIGARSFGDEVVVANFLTGVYYSLFGSAAQLWDGLMAGLPLGRVAGEIAAVSGIETAEFSQAAEKLVADLLDEKLIEPGVTADPVAWSPIPPDGDDYGLPVLERFTDMQDLLLLDPVHDVEEMGWPHAAPGPTA
jgi:hypothetical protein